VPDRFGGLFTILTKGYRFLAQIPRLWKSDFRTNKYEYRTPPTEKQKRRIGFKGEE